jgi:dihydroorotase (multifunctional complex type)
MKILKERDRVAKGKALVDYALYFGVPEREGELTEGFERLAVGFKIYMQEEFYSDKRDAVERVLEHASHKKALVVVHAEDPKFFRETSAGMVGTPKAEVSAIEDISRYNPNREFPLHITHLSSSAGLKEILKLKRVTSITSDTCPHYLLLTDDDVRTKGAFAKVDPHPKRTSDLTALLSGLRRGEIEALSSDHAPHTLEEKKDLEEAKSGFPGLETTLPLLLTMVDKKMFSLQDLVRVCAANPSKILGLSAIGEIERGKLGNLTIVDLQRRTKIDPKNFMSKAKYSPFEGREVKGVPVATIVRGQPVLLDGEVVARRGWGVNVKTYG